MITHGRPKRENHPASLSAKVQMRERILEEIAPARVLDLFCGHRELWRQAWNRAAEYVGCDASPWAPGEAPRYACDNRRLLRCLDLQRFNVFDLDAFGSPWEQLILVAARRKWSKGERGAVAITDGSTLKTRWGDLPFAMRDLCGLSGAKIAATTVGSEDLRRLAVAGFVRRAGVRLTRQWEAIDPQPARLYYAALCFVGMGP